MAKKHRFPMSIIMMILLVLPLIAACGGAPVAEPTPVPAAAQPTTAGAPAAATTAPDAAQPTAAQPATQPSGDVLDVTVVLPYLSQGITSFDHAFWSSQLLVSQGTIFEGLYGYDKDLNVVPKVAESATPNADSTVWTIKLRQDKKWSNGDPVTANDYAGAWRRLMSPPLKDAPMWAGPWGQIENGWAYKNGAIKDDELGIKVIDDYTLEVTLIEGNPAFNNLLAISTSMPINSKSLAEHPEDWWDPKVAVFNGPYVVESWVSGGDVTLKRNPNYVGDGNGNVGTIVLKPYPDANSRLQAFENGEIHFTFLEDPSQLAYAQGIPEIKDNIKEDIQDLVWRGIQFDRSLNPGPLTDIRVRQAFAMAIDKKAITDQVLKGMAVPTDAFTGDPDVISQIKSLPYDIEKAKQLLADAGFPGGQGFPELTFYAPPANDPQMPMIEAIVKMWKDNLGVPIVIQNNEGPVYNTLQWSNFNKDIQPGYATLGGPMNWFQPLDLLLNSAHTWWFMDFKEGGMVRYSEFQDKIEDARGLEKAGDWAELEARAKAAWAKRQTIIAAENNAWGETMKLEPTFDKQFAAQTTAYNEAADDAAKLLAYQNALDMILREEQSAAQYDDLTDMNKQAQRLIIELRQSSMEDGKDEVVKLQQLAVDAAWMVPIYNDKTFYSTDPHLSNIVLNKLSWGHIFQFQYLQWTP